MLPDNYRGNINPQEIYYSMTARYFRHTTVVAGVIAASLIALTTLSSAAQAQVQTFDLTYSGAALGNSATGTGTITLDLSKINNPGFTSSHDTLFVTNFSLTIAGAKSGNGTFTLADFGEIFLNINGSALDFSKELIGQPTATGKGTFGVDYSSGMEYSGDFNIFTNDSNVAAPNGVNPFTIITGSNSGDASGDRLSVTSFRPGGTATAAAPEPGSIVLLLTACAPMVGITRRRAKKQ